MPSARKFVFAACVCNLMLTVGCDQFLHKKKPATLPPRAQAPTIPLNLPDEIPAPAQEQPKIVVVEEPPPLPNTKQAPKPRRRNNGAKKTPPSPASGTGTTTVAANRPPDAPPEANTAIAADLSTDKAAKDKQTTAELLDSAEKTVKGL